MSKLPLRPTYFSFLAAELSQRAARATVSQQGPSSASLRETLTETLGGKPGMPGAFLADPVFESLFEWEPGEQKLSEIPYLRPSLVGAMDGAPDSERFGRDWYPHAHQRRAWDALRDRDADGKPLSVLVSTGTASGKTECFLVPVLNDLVAEAEDAAGAPTAGVRALFLYPLNALINSQKDRLEAWTRDYEGKLRFGLYNGNTPETVRVDPADHKNPEVRSRRHLRASPPQMLVTNATMLEYMLVRSIDRPILEASQGKLRWIIIDEAHTYVGSAAAEISLLLRRVLHAFGVRGDDVRFVATSATIGGDDADAQAGLAQYLADLAGIPVSRVVTVTGRRLCPPLPGAATSNVTPSLEQLSSAEPSECSKMLMASGPFRALRARLTDEKLTLSEIQSDLALPRDDVLKFLDLAGVTLDQGGKWLLPLRGHFFHAVREGLWACVDPNCQGKQASLNRNDWSYGKVFLDHRQRCDACASMVLELSMCRDCGTPHLACEYSDDGGGLAPTPISLGEDIEDLDREDEDEEEDANELHRMQMLCPDGGGFLGSEVSFEKGTGRFASSKGTLTRNLARKEGRLRCSFCGNTSRKDRQIFRKVNLGAPFYLATAVPTLLEVLDSAEEKGQVLPAGGRQLITFSDTRQGSATFAARTQYQAERGYTRAAVYHHIWHEALSQSGDTPEVRDKLRLIAQLKELGDATRPLVDKAEKELVELRSMAPVQGTVAWTEMVQILAQSKTLKNSVIPQMRDRYLASSLKAEEYAEVCLLREFFRRPRRMNSLETMGLARLTYPKLKQCPTPTVWKEQGHGLHSWHHFLEAMLTFHVRAMSAVDTRWEYLRVLGMQASLNSVVAPGEVGRKNRVYPWPSVRKGKALPRIARALIVALQLDQDSNEHREILDEILAQAWVAVRPLLEPNDDGYALSYAKQVHIATVVDGWICPITQRVLTAPILETTPFVGSLKGDLPPLHCHKIELPTLPAVAKMGPFKTEPAVQERLADWLEKDQKVRGARRAGVWTEFCDRIVAGPLYYGAAEHSAQQSSARLQELEGKFKEKLLNILSCSTTMEMGVNIGSLSAVAMNNAPPGPANFLQRAGRAGRRGQPRAVSLTMCRARPHDTAVFNNPKWPFTTPIHVPRVSLESEAIATRHVNSLLLSSFLRLRAEEGVSLNRCWLYSENPTNCHEFVDWLRGPALDDEHLREGVERLVYRTTLDSVSVRVLLEQSANLVQEICDEWVRVDELFMEQLAKVGGEPSDSALATPEQLSVLMQVKRHREEYLLRSLSDQGYLPSYGFPLNVVPFVNLTGEEKRARRNEREEKKKANIDAPAVRQDFPDRQLSVAIREYAPGASLVVDGTVFRSGGLTLNWKVPASADGVKDVQSLQFANKCPSCGEISVSNSPNDCCVRCQIPTRSQGRFIRPAGFAVDIDAQPGNDLSSVERAPSPRAVVSATPAVWQPFASANAGDFRTTTEGKLVFLSQQRYDVCLHCGRAAARRRRDEPAPELLNHRPLRGGRFADSQGYCTGNESSFAIIPQLRLGMSTRTDVFELRLRDPIAGAYLADSTIAYALGLALRQAAAESLGIESSEIGVTLNDYPQDTGVTRQSIVLYDTADGGAGYVTSLGDSINELFSRAREILDCPAGCDEACHQCLLSFATQERLAEMDRHGALAFLTDGFLAGLSLPKAEQIFGAGTRFEPRSLGHIVRQESARPDVTELRVHLGGRPGSWDLAAWDVWPDLLRVAGDRVVTLCVSKTTFDGLTWEQKNGLGRRLDGTKVGLAVMVQPASAGTWQLALEVRRGGTSLLVATEREQEPNESWGMLGHDRVVSGHSEQVLDDLTGAFLDTSSLGGSIPGQYTELLLGGAFNCRVDQIGALFWRALEDKVPELKALLEGAQKLDRVSYEDKYVRSPFIALVLGEVLRALAVRSGGTDSSTKLKLLTSQANSDRYPSTIKDDFMQSKQQAEALAAALPGCKVEIGAQGLEHRRELKLVWAAGRKAVIRLDHGFGFLRAQGCKQVNFKNDGGTIIKALNPAQLKVEPASLGLVYVSVS